MSPSLFDISGGSGNDLADIDALDVTDIGIRLGAGADTLFVDAAATDAMTTSTAGFDKTGKTMWGIDARGGDKARFVAIRPNLDGTFERETIFASEDPPPRSPTTQRRAGRTGHRMRRRRGG